MDDTNPIDPIHSEYIHFMPYSQMIQEFLNNVHNNIHSLNIQSMNIQTTNSNEIQIFIEMEDVSEEISEESPSSPSKVFKTCKDINDSIGKYEKIKKEDLDKECSICMDPFCEKEFKRVLPPCGHLFHKKCIDKWLKKNPSCPICRVALIKKNNP